MHPGRGRGTSWKGLQRIPSTQHGMEGLDEVGSSWVPLAHSHLVFWANQTFSGPSAPEIWLIVIRE